MPIFTFRRKNGHPMQWDLQAPDEAHAVEQMRHCFGDTLELVKQPKLGRR